MCGKYLDDAVEEILLNNNFFQNIFIYVKPLVSYFFFKFSLSVSMYMNESYSYFVALLHPGYLFEQTLIFTT